MTLTITLTGNAADMVAQLSGKTGLSVDYITCSYVLAQGSIPIATDPITGKESVKTPEGSWYREGELVPAGSKEAIGLELLASMQRGASAN